MDVVVEYRNDDGGYIYHPVHGGFGDSNMASSEGMTTIEVGRAEPGADDFLTARQARGVTDGTLAGYANHLGMVRRRSTKALLDLTNREATALAAEIARMRSGYSLALTMRMFYNFHGGRDDPRIAAFRIKSNRKRLAPSDVLTIEDVNTLIGSADYLRD